MSDLSSIGPAEVARRALWRDLAEKGIEAGVDWPRVVRTLFRDLDDAKTTEVVLRGEIRRTESALATFDDLADRHFALRAAIEALRSEFGQRWASMTVGEVDDRLAALLDDGHGRRDG